MFLGRNFKNLQGLKWLLKNIYKVLSHYSKIDVIINKETKIN